MSSFGIPISIKALMVCGLLALASGAAAYLVANSLTPVYESSGTVRVVVQPQGGLADPNVTAENDLTAQYSQLVSSDAVKRLTSQRLGVTPSSLDGKLAGSTVSAENLLQITASADSAKLARDRATAATVASTAYIDALNHVPGASYLTSVIGGTAKALTPAQLGHAGKPSAALLAQLTSDRAQVAGEAFRDASSGRPTLQIIDLGTAASQIAPRAKLYALVAFLVVLLVTLRLAFARRRALGLTTT